MSFCSRKLSQVDGKMEDNPESKKFLDAAEDFRLWLRFNTQLDWSRHTARATMELFR